MDVRAVVLIGCAPHHTSTSRTLVTLIDLRATRRYRSVMRPLRPDGIEVPLPRRYRDTSRGFAEGMERHRLAMGAGDPAYRDPISGLAVFTARFLADRGYCCDSGCRHCPYEPR